MYSRLWMSATGGQPPARTVEVTDTPSCPPLTAPPPAPPDNFFFPTAKPLKQKKPKTLLSLFPTEDLLLREGEAKNQKASTVLLDPPSRLHKNPPCARAEGGGCLWSSHVTFCPFPFPFSTLRKHQRNCLALACVTKWVLAPRGGGLLPRAVSPSTRIFLQLRTHQRRILRR